MLGNDRDRERRTSSAISWSSSGWCQLPRTSTATATPTSCSIHAGTHCGPICGIMDGPYAPWFRAVRADRARGVGGRRGGRLQRRRQARPSCSSNAGTHCAPICGIMDGPTPAGSGRPGRPLPAGWALGAASADFNGDGKPDIPALQPEPRRRTAICGIRTARRLSPRNLAARPCPAGLDDWRGRRDFQRRRQARPPALQRERR
jgi:hypothetical protein